MPATLIGNIALHSGPTGPSGPSGSPGTTGATGPSGAAGGGGGGSAPTCQYLNSAFTLATNAVNTPIFDAISVPVGQISEFAANLHYQSDDTGIQIYFGMSTTGIATILNADGELWYDAISGYKKLDASGGSLIGTGTLDGGAAITLAAINTPYTAKMRFAIQNNDTGPINVSFNAYLYVAGPTLTINTGSTFSATGFSAAISTTSGTTH